MSSMAAIFRGLFKVLGSPGLVVWLWMVNVAVALPLAAMMADSLEASIGASRVDEALTRGFDMGWFGEYQADAKGLEKTFTPTVVGVGAFLNNLDAWFNGSMFDGDSPLLGVGILYVLLWSLLTGGILERYSDGAGIFRLKEFFEKAGSHFFRFARLTVLSGILYYLIYRFAAWMFAAIEASTRDVTVEESIFAYVIAASALVVFLLALVNMAFDYAKIATYHENRRSMLLAALRGFGFVLTHPAKTISFYLGLGLVGAALLGLYSWIAPGALQSTTMGLILSFLVAQLYLITKLVLRLTFYAGQMEIYNSVR